MLDDTGSALGSKRKSLEPTKIDEKLPRVASLVSISKNSDNASSINGDTSKSLMSSKKIRDRMYEGAKRVYDPRSDPVIGRDSPGAAKYASTLEIMGNRNQYLDSRIR